MAADTHANEGPVPIPGAEKSEGAAASASRASLCPSTGSTRGACNKSRNGPSSSLSISEHRYCLPRAWQPVPPAIFTQSWLLPPVPLPARGSAPALLESRWRSRVSPRANEAFCMSTGRPGGFGREAAHGGTPRRPRTREFTNSRHQK